MCTTIAYIDADWVGDYDNCSISGYCVFLGRNLISCKSQKQKTVARSSTEAEYRALGSVVAETSWLRQLLQILGLYVASTRVLCDIKSALVIAANPVFHDRTKYFQIDHHFVREKVEFKGIQTGYVPSREVADIFTKGLPIKQNLYLKSKLCIFPDHVQFEGECQTS